MSFEQFLFYLFATALIGASAGMVIARNMVYAALLLILAFFNSAALWLLLGAEFLSITLVLVYVGAVMVLFLFVIMMLDLTPEKLKDGFSRYLPFGVAVLLLLVVEMAFMLNSTLFDKPIPVVSNAPNTPLDNTSSLGVTLYTNYLYPFEIAAVILLVAIIAAIMLTLRRRSDVKTQNIDDQIQVKRVDRVRLVTMQSGRSKEL